MTDDNKPDERSATGNRFQPGNTFGRGRAAGSRNKASLILDKMADEDAEAIFKSVLEAAKAEKVWAIELVLSRIWPIRKSRAVSIELPPMQNALDTLAAQAAIVQAATSGELTVDEAQALSALIEGHRRVLETVTLEERLRKLEEAISKR